MAWNFCPVCGHRVYKHNAEGCLQEVQVGEQCDCKVGYGQLVDRTV